MNKYHIKEEIKRVQQYLELSKAPKLKYLVLQYVKDEENITFNLENFSFHHKFPSVGFVNKTLSASLFYNPFLQRALKKEIEEADKMLDSLENYLSCFDYQIDSQNYAIFKLQSSKDFKIEMYLKLLEAVNQLDLFYEVKTFRSKGIWEQKLSDNTFQLVRKVVEILPDDFDSSLKYIKENFKEYEKLNKNEMEKELEYLECRIRQENFTDKTTKFLSSLKSNYIDFMMEGFNPLSLEINLYSTDPIEEIKKIDLVSVVNGELLEKIKENIRGQIPISFKILTIYAQRINNNGDENYHVICYLE